MRHLLLLRVVAVALAFVAATTAPATVQRSAVVVAHRTGLEGLLGAIRTQPLAAVRYSAFEQVTIDATAGGKSFTALKLSPNGSGTDPQATQGSCRLELAEIRFTWDGTTVTAAVGTLLEPGDWLTLAGNDVLRGWRGIRTGGTSGQMDCTYSQP